MKYVTIIGSRETPQNVLDILYNLAAKFYDAGYVLRSGGALGADTAAESGFIHGAITKKQEKNLDAFMEIYLPWKGFGENSSNLISPEFNNWDDALNITFKLHPNPYALKPGPLKLMGRNVYQVLGRDLKTPSDIVICWTKSGKYIGGTSQALRIVDWWNQHNDKKILCFNLGNELENKVNEILKILGENV